MFLRTIIGLLIGVACGTAIGAASFALEASLFGRGVGLLGNSIRLAAIIGAVYVGVPGAAVGAIVGGFSLGKAQGVGVGLAVGLLLVLLLVWRNEHRYFYEGSHFDKRLFLGDLVVYAAWLVGLALVAVMVSASVRRVLAAGR